MVELRGGAEGDEPGSRPKVPADVVEKPPPDDGEAVVEPKSKEELEREGAEKAAAELNELRAKNSKLLAEVDELKSLAASTTDGPKDLQRLHLLQIQPVRDILVISLVLGVFWLGYVLRSVTIPMLIALGLAYLVEPLVYRFTRRGHMSRRGSAIIVILIMLATILVPLGVGGTFAVAQGLQYGQQFGSRLTILRKSISNPGDTKLAAAVKEQGKLWGMSRDFIVKAQHPATPPAPVPPAAPSGVSGATGVTGSAAATGATGETGTTSPPPTPAVPPASGATGAPEVLAADIKTDKEGHVQAPLTAEAQDEKDREPLSAQFVTWLDDLIQRSGGSLGSMFGTQVMGTGGDFVRLIGKALVGSLYFLFSIFLVLFFFFFFSLEWEKVTVALTEMIPKWKRERSLAMFRQMDAVISGFVRGRITIMVILMVAFTVGFWLIGVPAPMIVGPITGVLAIIPYASLISIPLCWALMWMRQPEQVTFEQSTWWILLAPVLLYCLIQGIDDYVLNPIIQGKNTNMDTPTILFAVLAGGALLGFYGMLLAVPIAACLKIVIRDSFWPRFRAWADGKVKDFLPVSRYDPTEAGTGNSAGPKG